MERELAIDFGTSEFRSAIPGQGIVSRQPTCVVLDGNTGGVLYLGNEAKLKASTNPRTLRLAYPFLSSWIIGNNVAPIASEFMSCAREQAFENASDVRLLLSIPCDLMDTTALP